MSAKYCIDWSFSRHRSFHHSHIYRLQHRHINCDNLKYSMSCIVIHTCTYISKKKRIFSIKVMMLLTEGKMMSMMDFNILKPISIKINIKFRTNANELQTLSIISKRNYETTPAWQWFIFMSKRKSKMKNMNKSAKIEINHIITIEILTSRLTENWTLFISFTNA